MGASAKQGVHRSRGGALRRPLPDFGPIGPGATYSPELDELIARRPDLFPAVELEPQSHWIPTGDQSRPFRQDPRVIERLLAHPGRTLIHSVAAPVAGTVPPSQAQIDLLARVAAAVRAPYLSEHLSLNETADSHTGFFLPPRQTAAGAAIAERNIGLLRDGVGLPVAIENGVSYLKLRADEWLDSEFLATVATEADCGILLDLHNIYTNARNGREHVAEFLSRLPLDRVWELHLAGGMEVDGFYLDAHSGAIPAELREIARDLVPKLPNLKAVIFEMFPSFLDEAGLAVAEAQMEELHEIWALRGGGVAPAPSLRPMPLETGHPAISPEEWERTLGALVTGVDRRPPDLPIDELRSDPGVALVQGLIHEFRGSQVVRVLPLTARFLMLSIGPQAFRGLLAGFWRKVPPQMYGAREAEAFADYMASLNLDIPYLASLLDFERAAARTMADGTARVAVFDFEPVPLMRAVAEGRLPDAPLARGRFEIELTPDGDAAAVVAA